MKKVMIIAVVAVVLAAVGAVVALKFIGSGEKSVSSAEDTVNEEARSETVIYPMETFIVNLAGEGGRRYLKLKITLEINGSRKERLDNNLHKIRDSILILLSGKTFNDIKDAEGKYTLREEIKARLDRITGKGTVYDVYMVEFVVQ